MDLSAYVAEPTSRRSFSTSQMMHLNGVPWFEAPIPRRLHRCWPQTVGYLGFEAVYRCACGSLRNPRFFGWTERNSRKRRDDKPVPETPYIERKQAELDRFDSMIEGLESRAAALRGRSSSGE